MPVTINGGKIPIEAARVLLGMRGHRPSAFNIRVGNCMKAGGYAPTNGGRYDVQFQQHFIGCAASAGARIGASKRGIKPGIEYGR
jgi:hypothetical protein